MIMTQNATVKTIKTKYINFVIKLNAKRSRRLDLSKASERSKRCDFLALSIITKSISKKLLIEIYKMIIIAQFIYEVT